MKWGNDERQDERELARLPDPEESPIPSELKRSGQPSGIAGPDGVFRMSSTLSRLFQAPGFIEGLLGGLEDGLAILDTRGTQVFANAALCRLTGFSSEELVGATPPFPYWPKDELGAIEAAFARTMRGDRASFELVLQRKDGTRFWASVVPSALRDEGGVVVAHVATISDITERKARERALKESEQRWRSIAENPFDFVVVIDRDHRYRYVNHVAPGISPDSLIGRATPFDFVDERYHAAMREAFQTTFETGRASSYEVFVPQLDAWYSSVVGPILEGNQVTSISILTRDITREKRAEELLRRSEQHLREAHKMQSLGTLAGGIAHDLNNILTPVFMYAGLLQRSLPPRGPTQGYVEGILASAERARDLVQQILIFGRRRGPQKGVVDLCERVREGVKLLQASSPSSIVLAVDLPGEPVQVMADQTQIDQVLTNLATNALQAMGDRPGRLEISVRRVEAREPASGPRARFAEIAHAELTVRDTGPGMDQETQRRAFEPYFTTKSVGSGSGLGLSIVHGIIAEHGGEIMVESAPGEGASFTVHLPGLATGAAMATDSATSSPRPIAASLRVLCVDDEGALLEVVGSVLTECGHVVSEATEPRRAIELFTRNPQAFDVIITDQTMPNLKGTALILAVRALRPGMPCVLMTGLGDQDTLDRADALGGVVALAKPFSSGELTRAIEDALAAASRACA
jgi:PAS domain S-box-containing protein